MLSSAPGSFAEFLWVVFILLGLPLGLIVGGLFLFNTPILANFLASQRARTPQKPITTHDFSEAVVGGYWKEVTKAGFEVTTDERYVVHEFGQRLFDFEQIALASRPSVSLFDEGAAAKVDAYEKRTNPASLLDAGNEIGAALYPIVKVATAEPALFNVPITTRFDIVPELNALQSAIQARKNIFTKSNVQFSINRSYDDAKKTPTERQLSTFAQTPLYDFALWLAAQSTPLPIDNALRFRHQFVVGPTGSGKTTFLSAQINADLDKVARGEASVFVMDSQNELVPNIAKLARFAPGGDLAGKLVYLEPDPDYPLALNIFDFDKTRISKLSGKERVTLMRGAEDMIGFFIQSLVRAETTGFMASIIKPVLRATMLIPNATVFTFRDLLAKGGYAKYEAHLKDLSENDRRFITTDMFDSGFTMSLAAMRTRMAAFTSDELFTSMFTHPRNRLDLFRILNEPRVILVNTMGGMLKGATEPFGRFFLAKLLQATEERMFLAKENRLPVFAYIDEAQDYITHDENVPELIEKARKQNVALTLATHSPENFDANVRGALEKAGIQARGQTAPTWELSLSGKPPVPVKVPNTDFSHMPRMSDRSYEIMLQAMRNLFSVQATPTSAPQTPTPEARAPETEDTPPSGDWSR